MNLEAPLLDENESVELCDSEVLVWLVKVVVVVVVLVELSKLAPDLADCFLLGLHFFLSLPNRPL